MNIESNYFVCVLQKLLILNFDHNNLSLYW